jgi:hypothetical protein
MVKQLETSRENVDLNLSRPPYLDTEYTTSGTPWPARSFSTWLRKRADNIAPIAGRVMDHQ